MQVLLDQDIVITMKPNYFIYAMENILNKLAIFFKQLFNFCLLKLSQYFCVLQCLQTRFTLLLGDPDPLEPQILQHRARMRRG